MRPSHVVIARRDVGDNKEAKETLAGVALADVRPSTRVHYPQPVGQSSGLIIWHLLFAPQNVAAVPLETNAQRVPHFLGSLQGLHKAKGERVAGCSRAVHFTSTLRVADANSRSLSWRSELSSRRSATFKFLLYPFEQHAGSHLQITINNILVSESVIQSQNSSYELEGDAVPEVAARGRQAPTYTKWPSLCNLTPKTIFCLLFYAIRPIGLLPITRV